VVDPPRTGLSKKTIAEIIDLSPKRIVYVSCNPSTLARDIKSLLEEYRLVDIIGVDMFPRTKHVETVVLLRRKNIDDHLEFTWTDEEFGKKKGTLS
jgi:hypothetical protein